MMQAASDELLKKERAIGTHIRLRELWDHANYEIDLTQAEMSHLEACEDCVAVLALCGIEQSFEDLERKVKQADFFKNYEPGD
jgi:hypothetical protein